MALGKQIGEFSIKFVTTTVTPGPGNVQTWQSNAEGPVSGEMAGNYLGTMIIEWEPGTKSGTWKMCGVVARDDGDTIGGNSEGTWEEVGPHQWRYRGTGRMADGKTFGTEFEAGFATQTMTGKIYEWK